MAALKAKARGKCSRSEINPTCTAALVREALRQLGSPSRAVQVARFFKTGVGEYGAGDRFIGVTVPEQRRVARAFATLSLEELDALLTSPVHEERLTSLLILVDRFNGTNDEKLRGQIFRYYMKRLQFVNNWDLVDSSAEHIVGGWLADKPRALLDELAASKHLWSRRVALLATFNYIKQGDAKDTLRICTTLLKDEHDLIQKAAGWMLREIGKRVNEDTLRAFLAQHASTMHRTTLRYAIERFSSAERARWLTKRGPRLKR